MRSLRNRWWILLVGMMLAAGSAVAGTITVQWDPVSDTDLAGYRVYYGPTPGSHANQQNAGMSTTATLSNVADCSIHYVAIRAYDTGGLESTADSNSVKGFPRPVVSAVTPNSIKQGESKTFTITGTNFDAGVSGDATRPAARVRTSNSGLTITSSRVDACGQMTVTIQASSSAATGYATLYVENPDLSFSDPANHPWIYGSLANAINVTTSADTTPPTVSSTSPAAGATNVATNVKPTVTFSEAMLASSINSSTVKLIDAAGVAITQASGSPALSSDGRTATITPAAALKSSTTYRVQVVGGSSGAKDAAGNALASTWTQSPGFTTAAATDSTPPTVGSTWPVPGATNVPTNVRPTVTFSEAMLASSITPSTVRLIDAAGVAVTQASGAPTLSSDGRTATIIPAAALKNSATYRIQVVGGSSGVKDAAGNALASTYTQSPGFTIAAAADTTAPTVSSTNPPAGATSIATSVKPTVTFSEAMLATSITSSTVKLIDAAGAAITQASGSPALSSDGRTATITPAAALKNSTTYRIQVVGGSSGAKDAAGNALASTWTQSPGFTTGATSGATVVVSASPQSGQQRVTTTTRQVRITYNNDISSLFTSLSRYELQRTFRVTRLGRPLAQTSNSPAVENGGKTVVITLVYGLQSGATYNTEFGPLSSAGQKVLRDRGIDPGVLATRWRQQPGWTTASSAMGAYSRDTASSTQTATALTIPENPTQTPQENTNQPVTSEFLVEFDKPVVTSRLGGGIFRIVDDKGVEVLLKGRPRTENGGKNVVLTPAGKLDSGRKYRVVVRTGPSGVAFVEPDGSTSTATGSLVIPVATRVSGESMEPGVAP